MHWCLPWNKLTRVAEIGFLILLRGTTPVMTLPIIHFTEAQLSFIQSKME